MSLRAIRTGVVIGRACAGLLCATIALNSRQWIGATIPGFFVMANGVVPSIELPEWTVDRAALFQHQVVAVDGVATASAAAIYERVRSRPAGTSIRYTL